MIVSVVAEKRERERIDPNAENVQKKQAEAAN
jgi:hypothetical protein